MDCWGPGREGGLARHPILASAIFLSKRFGAFVCRGGRGESAVTMWL